MNKSFLLSVFLIISCIRVFSQQADYRELKPVNYEGEISHLPLVLIDTYGQTITDEPKINVTIKVIDHGPGQINRT
jgi:hypothetical protein